MSASPVTLPILETYLANDRQDLGKLPEIDRLYAEQIGPMRRDALLRGFWPGVILYNAFLVIDAVLLPGTFALAVFLHALVVTPILLAAGLIYRTCRSATLCETAAALVPAAIVGQIMVVFAVNGTEAASQYQYLALLVLVHTNMNQRLAFRPALASTALVGAIYLGTLLSAPVPMGVKVLGAALMAGVAYLSLRSNWFMEEERRAAFLGRLHVQLQREATANAAKHDALTGLVNRRCLDEEARRLWDLGEASSPVAVIMIDIDHFKAFNDRYGHIAGDTCLKRVAGAIAAELRGSDDLAVRFGGEEFLMVLPQTGARRATEIAERIRRRIAGLGIPHEAAHPGAVVTASLGVATGRVSVHSLAELISGADIALYEAKRGGRDQVWPPLETDEVGAFMAIA